MEDVRFIVGCGGRSSGRRACFVNAARFIVVVRGKIAGGTRGTSRLVSGRKGSVGAVGLKMRCLGR